MAGSRAMEKVRSLDGREPEGRKRRWRIAECFGMKTCRLTLALFAFLILLGSGYRDVVRVPQSEIDAVNARYAAYGLTLPKDGIVLSAPYDPPFSNRSFIVPKEWIEQQDPRWGGTQQTAVAAAAVRADLPTLRLIMEKTYAGWQTAAARGWSWDAWFAKWDNELAKFGDEQVSPAAALEPWSRLEDFQSDNHSRPILPGFSSNSLSGQLASAPLAPCNELHMASGSALPIATSDAGAQPHAVQVWDGRHLSAAWYVAFPDRHGTATSIMCARHRIALTMTSQPRVMAENATYTNLGGGISYIRAPSLFSYKNDEALTRAVADARGVGTERIVLLDLRGNRGGAAPLGLLTHWFTAKELEHVFPIGTRSGTQSCFATGIGFNLGQLLSVGLKAPLSEDSKDLLQHQLDAIGNESPGQCDVKPVVLSGGVTLLDHRFTLKRSSWHQTRIVAIVDNVCGSDCEGLAMTLSLLPDTVLAGTNTAGTVGFVQPGFFVLPHSRLPFELATARDDNYGDGRSEASYGISVDVLLPTSTSQDVASLRALAEALSQ